MSASLAGLTVIVTRPQRQAEALIAKLTSIGARTIAFPTLAIEPVLLDERNRERLAPDQFDWTIYTSSNAVEQSLQQLPRPRRTRIAAIGSATARTLEEHGVGIHAVPTQRIDSEGLLALPEFASVHGLRILVLRGVGGREMLRQTLMARGATVETGELYRRTSVTPTASALDALRAALSGEVRAVVAVTSVEILDALLLVAPRDLHRDLVRAPLLVPGDRVAAAAHERGWTGPLIVARSAEDTAIVEALLAWRANGKHGPA